MPLPEPRGRRARRPTSTASFGSSRREAHDASAFYDRFAPPEVSADAAVNPAGDVDVVHLGDARNMSRVPSSSVALVVTSPPYFAGKDYEQSLGENGVPATYFEYLALLRDVFAECKRVLEPGGRIGVNVANLGRRPFRSLAGDVTDILQGLGLLLRGEVVWWKGRAAGGSCAWGTFQRPANPVLRDVTERIVVAGKGRFDRAVGARQRGQAGLPSVATISRDEFLEATTDLWEIPPESATRVGHPAPFPVELPRRVIELYTYEGDVVLDPFLGSGSTAVAALRTGRHFVGFDTDAAYVQRALARVAEERGRLASAPVAGAAGGGAGPRLARALAEGRRSHEVAEAVLADCAFASVRSAVRLPALGVELDLVAADRTGSEWAFEVGGSFATSRPGLKRSDELWKAIAKASVLQAAGVDLPLVVLTTELPAPGTSGAAALRAVTGPGLPVFDVVHVLRDDDRERLRSYAANGLLPIR